MNKKIIITIMICGIIFGSIGAYAGSNFYASDVSVNAPTGSNLGSNATLQSSLDELYSIADKYTNYNFFPARFISAAGICSLRHSYPHSFEYAYIAGSCLERNSAGASVTEYAPQCPNSIILSISSLGKTTSRTMTSATVHKLPHKV